MSQIPVAVVCLSTRLDEGKAIRRVCWYIFAVMDLEARRVQMGYGGGRGGEDWKRFEG
jgi:hypothetical protein